METIFLGNWQLKEGQNVQVTKASMKDTAPEAIEGKAFVYYGGGYFRLRSDVFADIKHLQKGFTYKLI